MSNWTLYGDHLLGFQLRDGDRVICELDDEDEAKGILAAMDMTLQPTRGGGRDYIKKRKDYLERLRNSLSALDEQVRIEQKILALRCLGHIYPHGPRCEDCGVEK